MSSSPFRNVARPYESQTISVSGTGRTGRSAEITRRACSQASSPPISSSDVRERDQLRTLGREQDLRQEHLEACAALAPIERLHLVDERRAAREQVGRLDEETHQLLGLAADAADAKALLRAAITAWLDSGGYDGTQLDELLLE